MRIITNSDNFIIKMYGTPTFDSIQRLIVDSLVCMGEKESRNFFGDEPLNYTLVLSTLAEKGVPDCFYINGFISVKVEL